MDWMEFIASLIGSLAWPLVALIVVLLFKEQIRARIRNIKSAKGAGVEVQFSEEVKLVAEDAQLIAAHHGVESKAQTHPPSGDDQFVPRGFEPDLEGPPVMVVIRAYGSVEHAMSMLIEANGIEKVRPEDGEPGFYGYTLFRAGVIDEETYDLIRRLRRLRDEVAVALDRGAVDRATSVNYYWATRQVLRVLFRAYDHLREKKRRARGQQG